MPIPDEYRDICEMLIAGTKEGRVMWTISSGSTISVVLPQFILEIWSGTDENDEKAFVAIGLRTPDKRGLLDNWYVEEGDADFDMMKFLYDTARRHARKIPQKLDTLREILQSGQKIGIDDKDNPK